MYRKTENTEFKKKIRYNKFFEALEKYNGCISKAMLSLGYKTHVSFYNFLKDKDFKERFEKMKSKNEEIYLDYLEGKLHDHIENNNLTAVIYALNNKGKKRGYNVNETNLNLKNEIVIEFDDNNKNKE